MPSKLYMTVPVGFRRMANIPEILVLYRAKLQAEEIVIKQGYKITTPLRTLIDIVEDGSLADDLLIQAIRDVKKKGLVTQQSIETHQRCSVKVREKLLKIMKGAV